MTVNLDRFSCGYTPKPAIEVGTCNACGDVIYDYELTRCGACDAIIHERCKSKCDKCGARGCKGENGCLTDIDGLRFCIVCKEIDYVCKYAA